MALFTPATSLEARSASDRTTAEAAAAAAQRGVKKLLSPNIVVVGCINEDTTIDVERLPAPGETVLGKEVRTTYGGKGANQAVQAALLMPHFGQTAAAQGQQRPVGAEAAKEDDTRKGATAATLKEKLALASEKAAATAKTAGEGVTSAVEGWLSQLSPTSTYQEDSAHDISQGGKELLLKKASPGEKVALICKLGSDEAGARYAKYLSDVDVHTGGVFTAVKGKPTGRAFITVSIQGNGENAIAYVPGANEHLTPSDIQQPHVVSLLQQAKVVVCENGVPAGVTTEALRLAKSAPDDIITIFIPSPVAHVPREAFAYADYIVLNALEAQQLYDQLVPLPRVRDTAGHIFEEQHEEEKLKEKEKEWPSLYATASAESKSAKQDKRRGSRSFESGGGASSSATGTNMPSPLALRERLRAVGAHTVEIHPTAPTTWGGGHSAATAGHPGFSEAAKRAANIPAATHSQETAQDTGEGATLAKETTSLVVPNIPTAATAYIEAAVEGEKEGQVKRTEKAERTAGQSTQARLYSDTEVPRRGKCDVIITTGSTGCTVTRDALAIHVPPRRVVQDHDIVDTVGAGDAFVGALAYFLAHDKEHLEDAVAKAGVVASYSVQRKGASVSYATRQTLGEDFFKI